MKGPYADAVKASIAAHDPVARTAAAPTITAVADVEGER
jgi:hypothetical protein